jgi:hypothetical protein
MTEPKARTLGGIFLISTAALCLFHSFELSSGQPAAFRFQQASLG